MSCVPAGVYTERTALSLILSFLFLVCAVYFPSASGNSSPPRHTIASHHPIPSHSCLAGKAKTQGSGLAGEKTPSAPACVSLKAECHMHTRQFIWEEGPGRKGERRRESQHKDVLPDWPPRRLPGKRPCQAGAPRGPLSTVGREAEHSPRAPPRHTGLYFQGGLCECREGPCRSPHQALGEPRWEPGAPRWDGTRASILSDRVWTQPLDGPAAQGTSRVEGSPQQTGPPGS